MTAAPALTETFPGIGGSEIAAIMGISPFATPLDVWRSKVLHENVTETPAMAVGKRFEPHIIAAYRAQLPEGSRIWTPERTLNGIFRVSPDALAEVDGWQRLVEAKSTIMGDEWGDEGTDGVPLYYAMQGNWYMDHLGLEECDFPVIKWPHRTALRDVLGLTPAEIVAEVGIQVLSTRYSPTLAKTMREKATEFWEKHVLTETPPEPVDLADAKRLVWMVKGKTAPIDEIAVDALARRQHLKDEMKRLQDKLDTADLQLRNAIGDAEALLDPSGNQIVTLKTIEKGAYMVKPQSYRQIHITKHGKELLK